MRNQRKQYLLYALLRLRRVSARLSTTQRKDCFRHDVFSLDGSYVPSEGLRLQAPQCCLLTNEAPLAHERRSTGQRWSGKGSEKRVSSFCLPYDSSPLLDRLQTALRSRRNPPLRQRGHPLPPPPPRTARTPPHLERNSTSPPLLSTPDETTKDLRRQARPLLVSRPRSQAPWPPLLEPPPPPPPRSRRPTFFVLSQPRLEGACRQSHRLSRPSRPSTLTLGSGAGQADRGTAVGSDRPATGRCCRRWELIGR